MLDAALLASVARQMLSGNKVNVNDKDVPVRRTSTQRLKTLSFTMDGREFQAIEQNPEKPSRWGKIGTRGATCRAILRIQLPTS